MSSMRDTMENGVRVVRYPNGSVKWRGDCAYCVRVAASPDRPKDPVGGFFPTHDAMPGCRSGRRDHCTCDGCF